MSKNLNELMQKTAIILMNNIQMGVSYIGWGDEYSYSSVKDTYTNIKEQLKELMGDFNSLTLDELEQLGFVKWEEEGDLYLVPLWIFDLIPDGTELIDISGGSNVKGTDYIDLDVRFGCIAYGVIRKEVVQ